VGFPPAAGLAGVTGLGSGKVGEGKEAGRSPERGKEDDFGWKGTFHSDLKATNAE
jgi:hypothetical protein